jgi:enamine deaminase RidA (YjgF/YER057c/UK114 family)
MNKLLNPKTVAPPFSRYSQGVATDPGARWLHVSGQVGVRPDGSLAEGFEAQYEQALKNVLAVVQAAGMKTGDIVKLVTYMLPGGEVAKARAIRLALMGDAAPASTLVLVAGLASAAWLVEIEAIAAKAVPAAKPAARKPTARKAAPKKKSKGRR